MTAIFEVTGGIGKHVAFSGVINSYALAHPDEEIIVVCAWPEVFLHNPKVSKVFMIGNTPYFYRDYIYNKEVKVFAQEPYKQQSHILKEKSLIKTWCDLVGIDDENSSNPELFITQKELEVVANLLPKRSDKPLLIIQPFGGAGQQHQPAKYSWARDLHPVFAQAIVNELSTDHDVVYVCYEHHPELANCFRLDKQISKNSLFGLLKLSDKRLLVDSSLQHAAAALGLKSTVQWVATSPTIFGYDLHDNILPNKEYPLGGINSYLYDYNFAGEIHECPYIDPSEIFDLNKIVNSVRNQ
jgi:hypothetical protein